MNWHRNSGAISLPHDPCYALALYIFHSYFTNLIVIAYLLMNIDQKLCLCDWCIMGKSMRVVNDLSIKFKAKLFNHKGFL